MSAPRLTKTAIEYGDYHWGFYSGCQHGDDVCPINHLCWNLPLTLRFPKIYPNGRKPTFYPESFLSPLSIQKPSRILCAFSGDLFGNWVDLAKKFDIPLQSPGIAKSGYMTIRDIVFGVALSCPQHTFIFLTKNAQGLVRWSPFPPNCYVGVTACNPKMAEEAGFWLWEVKAKVIFVSFEPLLERIPIHFSDYISDEVRGIKWLIIGALTGSKTALQVFQKEHPALTLMPYGKRWTLQPRIEWVIEILETAYKAGVPVFLKNNLLPSFDLLPVSDVSMRPLWVLPGSDGYELRQEMPKQL